jgi:hypothetical protein
VVADAGAALPWPRHGVDDLHLYHEKEVAALLGIPDDITQTVLLPVAYYTGTDFRLGTRVPAHARTYWDAWGLNR